jgi:tripartite-type tricarboxylate transporter receptor subunit TctC
MFNTLAKINTVHIPYRTEPPAIIDLLSGQVHMIFTSYSTVAAHLRDGKLRPLVTTLPARSPLLPEVPSIVEAGFPKYPIVPWAGMVGPAKMPKDVVERLNREIVAILGRPEIKEQLAKQAFAPRSSTSQEFADHMREQLDIWGKAIKDAGIQPE